MCYIHKENRNENKEKEPTEETWQLEKCSGEDSDL